MKKLQVSRSTARFIQQGHPWVRVDKFTKGLQQLKAGEMVTLCDERGKELASALADPNQEICARVYHKRPQKTFKVASALDQALKKRQALYDDPTTNCYRVVHGESDFLPALRIESLGQFVVILLRASCMQIYLPEIVQWCTQAFPQSEIIIKEQFDDLRRHPLKIYDRNLKPCDPQRECIGLEDGVQVICRPAEDLATGVYVDQRATRQWLRQHCVEKDIANAFAYTGLFSAALLSAGAKSSTDIDISAPALELAQRNAELNQVSNRHTSIVSDSISFFKQHTTEFDIIILDPPTAAHGKQKQSWILRRDYPILIEQALKRLRPNGLLIACRNTLGMKKQFALRTHITERHPALSLIDNPSMGVDIPALKGFPESKPYELVIARKT